MKKILLSGLLCLSSFTQAQTAETEIQKRLQDPKIPWMTEYYLDLEDLHSTNEGLNIQNPQRQKWKNDQYINPYRQQSITLQRLSKTNTPQWDIWLNTQVLSPNGKKYADAQLSRELSAKEVLNILQTTDTIIVFNPETLAEEQQIITNKLDVRAIKAYRLRLLYYYDAAQGQLLSLPLAIAPLKERLDDNGKPIDIQPLFWLPVKAQNKLLLPSEQPQLPLIRSIYFDIAWAGHRFLKSQIDLDSMIRHFGKQIYQKRNTIRATANDNLAEPSLTDSAIGAHFSIMIEEEVFNPEDFTTTIIKKEKILFQPKSIVGLRDHHWLAWDPKQNCFLSSPYSLALIREINNDANQVLATIPMFYLYPLKWYR